MSLPEHQINQLEGLPLLPCGGPTGKQPINEDGSLMTGWQNAAFTPEQILQMNGKVNAVGTRTGPDADYLLILDIDGASAVDKCREFNCFPKDTGWVIRRDTDPHRLKVAFYISEQLRNTLTRADGSPLGKRVLQTKAAVYDTDDGGHPKRDNNNRPITLHKQEAIELFYGSGQCVVLGSHKASGGSYYWDGSPIQLTEPSLEWWELINFILQSHTVEDKARTPVSAEDEVTQSGPLTPCIICGRDTSSACTTYTSHGRGRVNCFEGQTFSPPTDLGIGDTITRDGKAYAFCGHGFNDSVGPFLKFAEHQKRQEPEVDELDDDDLYLQQEALKHFKEAQEASVDLIDVFGPIWGQLLIDRAAAFPCDPSMLLLPMLGYCSSLIGNKACVRIKEGWSEPLIVWGMIAQPPSSMKSPAGGVFGKPLAKLQGIAAEAHHRQQQTFKLKEKRWKAECTQLQQEAKNRKQDEPDLPEPPPAPVPPRHYYFDSVTIERLAEVLAQSNVHGTICFHDELAKWFSSLEKKAGQSDRPTWLNLWTGQALKCDTKTSGNSFAEATAVSIIGFIQPDKLAQLIEKDGDSGAAGDGLWARFLTVIPRTIPFKFNPLEVDLTEDLLYLAEALDAIPPRSELHIGSGALNQAFIPAWDRWSDMEVNTSAARASFIGKLRGYSVRIAGILHLINTPVGDIDQHTAEVAVRLCDFFLAQFDQLMPQVSDVGEVDTNTARFLQKVKDRDLKEVRVRDLQRWNILGKGVKSKECEQFLRNLAASGQGEFIQLHTKGSKKGAWGWRP